jgi:hypothetical protein
MRLSFYNRVLKSKILAVLLVIAASIGILAWASTSDQPGSPQIDKPRAIGVCPPFPLRDAAGNFINPVNGTNAEVLYSPKQTCGAKGCHDYDKITQGFHFTQGKGENMPPEFAAPIFG